MAKGGAKSGLKSAPWRGKGPCRRECREARRVRVVIFEKRSKKEEEEEEVG